MGVDIGGTFTDIVFLGPEGTLYTKKVSSSVDNYAHAIVAGMTAVLHEAGLSGGDIAEVRHGTTVASNAILELKGARTGLITTKGFRDILEIRNLRMPRLYDLTWQKPPPLVERYLRVVVDERVNVHGRIEQPLDLTDAERAVDRFLDARQRIQHLTEPLVEVPEIGFDGIAGDEREIRTREGFERGAVLAPQAIDGEDDPFQP